MSYVGDDSKGRTGSKTSSPPKIVAIDDMYSFLRTAKLLIERNGFEAITLPQNETSLNAIADNIRASRPCAVITDYLMDGFNGIDVLKRLRQEFPELPIYLWTGGYTKTRSSNVSRVYRRVCQGGASYLIDVNKTIN